MQVPEKLSTIMDRLENLTENKADKADIEGLKGEMKTLDEKLTGEMKTLKAEIITKQDGLRDLNKSNFRIVIGILLAILAVVVKSAFFPK